MPTYEYTGPKTRKGNPVPHDDGEKAVTVPGSYHDRRLAGSADWKLVEGDAPDDGQDQDDD